MNNPSTSVDKFANTLNEEYSRNSLRQIFRDKRSALSLDQQTLAATEVLNQAVIHKLFTNCTTVGIYLTNEGELNTQPIIEYLWNKGIQVYLPVLHPFCKGYLVFLHYTPSTKMKLNVYGILEPILDVSKLCPIAQLDLILVPLVAFDMKGNRMGMGGGFYDRTIKNIAKPISTNLSKKATVNHSTGHRSKADSSTRLIGLAHDVQHTKALPVQVWDIPLPAILTPTTLYSF